MFIEILFKMLLFKGGVLIYAEHCMYIYIVYICENTVAGQITEPWVSVFGLLL